MDENNFLGEGWRSILNGKEDISKVNDNPLVHWHEWDCPTFKKGDTYTDRKGGTTCSYCLDRTRLNKSYPMYYDLLGRGGRVLGTGIRFLKYQKIKWNLPFLEGSEWIGHGRKTRLRKRGKDDQSQ